MLQEIEARSLKLGILIHTITRGGATMFQDNPPGESALDDRYGYGRISAAKASQAVMAWVPVEAGERERPQQQRRLPNCASRSK